MHALKGVDFDLNGGECVALLGENGAGKSTLIKVLGGAHQPDEGSLEIDGQPMVFEKPTDSLDAGIAIIYQEFNLVPGLSVAENVFLGMEPNDFGWVRMSEQKRRVEDTCKRIGANLSPSALCEDLTVAERQLVEIAKALVRDARVLVMDEPSARSHQEGGGATLSAGGRFEEQGNRDRLRQSSAGGSGALGGPRGGDERRRTGRRVGPRGTGQTENHRTDGRSVDGSGISRSPKATGRSPSSSP